MARIRIPLAVLVVLVVPAALCSLSCPSEDQWACVGGDHRPQLPASPNACHEAFELAVRVNECEPGFYDQAQYKGLEGRNGKLAYYFALADHATAAELTSCEENIATYQAQIDAEDCADPSTDCGPEPRTDTACHTFYQAMADWRLACDPGTFAADGFNSYDAFLDSKLAASDYSSDEEWQSPCTSQLDFYLGPCM
jgi:hypothetical protein